jgi:two-component SAPR family response regulator
MSRPRVILVEDESLVALMMEDLLDELGCEVIASFAALGPALAWLQETSRVPDGAVLDVNLGGQMVFPLAAELAARKIPFVFATGYGALADQRFAQSPLIHKPVDLAKLAPAIELFGRAA